MRERNQNNYQAHSTVPVSGPVVGGFLGLFLSLVLGMASLWGLELKSPPSDGIYDPAGVLDEEYHNSIKQLIEYERKNRNFELFLILYDEEPTQGADVLSKQAGESWSVGEYWAVVYQVGADGDPECLVGGAKMKQISEEVISRIIRGARGAALIIDGRQNRLDGLAGNIADGFGFLYLQADQNYKKLLDERQKAYEEKQAKKKRLKIILVVLAILALGLAVLGAYLWKKYFRKMKPVEFPETTPRRRLTAPYSGGGDVLIKYKRGS